MSVIEAKLLSAPTFKIDSRDICFSRKKAAALLIFIICNNRIFYREELAEIFWPNCNSSQSLRSLRTVISELRKLFKDDFFYAEKEKIYIDRTNLSCDYLKLKTIFSKNKTHTDMEKVAKLWKGGFLKGFYINNSFPFNEWQRQEEQNIFILYKSLLKTLYNKEIDKKNYPSALKYAIDCLNIDNFDEETHRAIIYIHAITGERKLAYKQYENCCKIINDEFNSVVEEETIELMQKIKSGNIKKITSSRIMKNNKPRLAILPFTTSSNFNQELLLTIDMIMEGLENFFAGLSNIKTISRTSTLAYSKIEKRISLISSELNADYIIEGFIAEKNNSLLIEGRLIDSKTDTVLKVNSININSINSEDPANISRIIGKSFIPYFNISKSEYSTKNLKYINDIGDKSQDSISTKLKLHAQHLLRADNNNSYLQAITLYKKAIQINPNDFQSWAGLAQAYLSFGDKEICCPNQNNFLLFAEKATIKALKLNSKEPTALNNLGNILILKQWDFEKAERLYKKSLSIFSNNSRLLRDYAELCILTGRLKEAKKLSQMATEINPISLQNFKIRFWLYLLNKEYRKAKNEVKQQFIIYPAPALEEIMKAYIQLIENKVESALKTLDKIKETIPLSWQNALLGAKGYAYAKKGNQNKAYEAIDLLMKNISNSALPFLPIALIFTGLEDYDNAIKWIEKSVKKHDQALFFLSVNPLFSPLNSQEKLQETICYTHIIPIIN